MKNKKQAFDSKVNENGSISIYSTYRDEFGEKITVDNRITKERAVEISNQLLECINYLDQK